MNEPTLLPDCPYKGLQPYTEADRAYFFGRERDREMIIANLYASPLTVLYGGSGVGKSSVLLAGVAPELKETPRLAVVVFRDWQDPRFKAALKLAVLREVTRSAGKTPDVDEHLPFDEFLAQCLNVLRGQSFFILDQFEEYFLYHPPAQSAEDFDAEFARAVNRPEIRANFLLSVREDGLSKLDRFQGRIPNLLGNMLRLDHLSREEAASAIRQPLAVYNQHLPAVQEPMSIEDGLVEVLLEEVKAGKVTLDQTRRGRLSAQSDGASGEARIETPFLQIVLTRLWDEERAAGSRRLRLSSYTELGGTEKIARTHLEKEMRLLKPEEREAATHLFRYLVTPSGMKIAQDPGALAVWSEMPAALAESVLARLSRDVRILRRVSVAGQPDRYEIFHDTLAPAILDWAQEQAQVEAEQRLARERQQVFRLRMWRAGLVLLLVAVIILALLVLRVQRTTQSRELAASAISKLNVDPAESVFLAAEAVNISRTAEAKSALRRALLESRVRAVLRGHKDDVSSATFSSDGKYIVTASHDKTARVWETSTGKQIKDLEHTAEVKSAVFSRDGKFVITVSDRQPARLWEWETGAWREVKPPDGDNAKVKSAAFSPDGKLVVMANEDKTVILWDVGAWRQVTQPLKHDGEELRAAFSPDSKLVVTASGRVASVWQASTGRKVAQFTEHEAVVSSAAFSADSKLIVTADGAGTARVWEAGTGRRVALMSGHLSNIYTASFSPDNKWVVTAGQDRTARVWEASTGREVAPLRGHADAVYGASFSSDGRLIVTVSYDGTGQVWEAVNWNKIAELRGHRKEVKSVAFSPDGKLAVTASGDQTARLWDIGVGHSEIELSGHTDEVKRAVFSPPDDKFVVTASADNTVRLWEASNKPKVRWQKKHEKGINSVAFSPDGSLVATASKDKTVRFWEVSTGQPVGEPLQHDGVVNSVAFSPDGKFVATASDSAQVWERKTGKGGPLVKLGSGHGSVYSVSYSPGPDSKYLITSHFDKIARVWETGSWRQASGGELKAHTDVVESAAFSRDGRFILTAGRDRVAWIWKAGAWEKIVQLRGHTRVVSSATFSPNGEVAVTSSEDYRGWLWDVGTGQSLIVLRGHTQGVNSATFSSDGKLIVTAGKDKVARIFRCEECGSIIDDLLRLAESRNNRTLTPEEQERLLRENRVK